MLLLPTPQLGRVLQGAASGAEEMQPAAAQHSWRRGAGISIAREGAADNASLPDAAVKEVQGGLHGGV